MSETLEKVKCIVQRSARGCAARLAPPGAQESKMVMVEATAARHSGQEASAREQEGQEERCRHGSSTTVLGRSQQITHARRVSTCCISACPNQRPPFSKNKTLREDDASPPPCSTTPLGRTDGARGRGR